MMNDLMKRRTGPDEEASTTITRYQVISECIDIMEGIKRSFSRDSAMQAAQPGYGPAFEAVNQKITILKQLLLEARYGREIA